MIPVMGSCIIIAVGYAAMASRKWSDVKKFLRLAKRPSWDEWALGIAEAVATRADCTRRKVGAVILDKDHRIVSTGYNGSPPGGPSCLAGACPRGRHYELEDPPETIRAGFTKCACGKDWDPLYGGCPDAVQPGSSYDTGAGSCIALHAEQNAIIWAAPERLAGSTMYITCAPCDGCARLIAGVGITRVIWPGKNPQE